MTFLRQKKAYEISLGIGLIKEREMSDDFLTSTERGQLKDYSGQRISEFMNSRYLIKDIVIKKELGVSKKDIEITNGVFGQPILTIKNTLINYGISISHKPNLIGCVIYDQKHPIGIDIEELSIDKASVLHHQMSNEEKKKYTKKFDSICLWTAKEALSKVLNCGMAVSFKLFEISEFARNKDKFMGCFLHFPLYRFESFKKSGHIITLVFPSMSNLKIKVAAINKNKI